VWPGSSVLARPVRRSLSGMAGEPDAGMHVHAGDCYLDGDRAGDTLYPQLEIIDRAPHGDAGQVTTRATIRNQHGQLVLDGEHTYLLKTAQQSTSQATS
jgi:hypothetical protein